MIREAYQAGIASALEKIANDPPGAIPSPTSAGGSGGALGSISAQTQIRPTNSSSSRNLMRFKVDPGRTNITKGLSSGFKAPKVNFKVR